ncbi:ABC transporter ATP-binding protein [Enterococcus sp. AD013-P3]|uniref:ABC transporter ATP-binding protein n=1 Tax=Enterococcus sp. AD013-P3 TaxID=3411036 RepID=UPI003B92D137
MARNKFDVDEELAQEFSWSDLKRLAQYIRPYKGPIIKVLATIILANTAGMLAPIFTQRAIDTSIPQKNMQELLLIGAAFLVTLVVIAICMRYRIFHITEIGQDVLKDMRFDIFEHLQRLPFSYFDNRPHGKILIRVVNYINTLSDLLSNGLINLISDIFNVIITLVFMFSIDFKLTLYSLMLLPVLFVMVLFIQGKQRVAYQVLSNKQSNMNAYIHESISGIKITQSFAREEENLRVFQEVSEDYRSSWMHAVKIQFLLWPGVQNISVITMCIIYFVGVRQIGVEVSTGTLIAFIAYINNFWNPVINIGNFYNSLITATAYLERIFETMDEVPDIQDKPGAIELPQIKGNVDFEHVTFRYEEGKDILKDVSFHIDAGQSIALVGPTGAGKTTVINLLSRFYDINEGSVKIDGYDVRDVTLNSLRRQMGVMLQDTFVFSGTIMENIRYGKLDATEEEIIAAAKVVRAHDFIKELKDGYNTVVEERGSTLSAGQRQLISFARALLADPKILILDEATSSIDTKTEELLQEGLLKLLEGRTSFIIAHRLSTIKNSDKIFYVSGGTIAEAGSHDELMAQGGLYHHLYQSQYDLLQAI